MIKKLWDKFTYFIGRRPQGSLERGYLQNNKATFLDRLAMNNNLDTISRKLASKF
ncbi:hypothetical protein PSSHI_47460 [Photobacterium sp. R1]